MVTILPPGKGLSALNPCTVLNPYIVLRCLENQYPAWPEMTQESMLMMKWANAALARHLAPQPHCTQHSRFSLFDHHNLEMPHAILACNRIDKIWKLEG